MLEREERELSTVWIVDCQREVSVSGWPLLFSLLAHLPFPAGLCVRLSLVSDEVRQEPQRFGYVIEKLTTALNAPAARLGAAGHPRADSEQLAYLSEFISIPRSFLRRLMLCCTYPASQASTRWCVAVVPLLISLARISFLLVK